MLPAFRRAITSAAINLLSLSSTASCFANIGTGTPTLRSVIRQRNMCSTTSTTPASTGVATVASTSTQQPNDSQQDPPQQEPRDEYVLPRVWTQDDAGAKNNGGKWASINRPTAGARHNQELPRGKHPLQLYSMGTPNGQKVTILLEELLEAGYTNAEYDAFYISIGKGDQFGSGFVDINPNSKIPALLDTTTNTRMFESGSILLQLSEKFDNAFCPPDIRSEVLNWLFWQMGSGPFLGGGFGHFFHYAPYKMKYPIDRFTMEVKRQLDVLEQQLSKHEQTNYLLGEQYTLADIAIYPWYGRLVLGKVYRNADVFLNVQQDYPHVIQWAKNVASRPAVIRGSMVNQREGNDSERLEERHDASDFDGKALSAKL